MDRASAARTALAFGRASPEHGGWPLPPAGSVDCRMRELSSGFIAAAILQVVELQKQLDRRHQLPGLALLLWCTYTLRCWRSGYGVQLKRIRRKRSRARGALCFAECDTSLRREARVASGQPVRYHTACRTIAPSATWP